MMAGLAFGPRITVIGAGTGMVTTGLAGGLASMLIFGLVHAIPALLIVYLALLSRENIVTQRGNSPYSLVPLGPYPSTPGVY